MSDNRKSFSVSEDFRRSRRCRGGDEATWSHRGGVGMFLRRAAKIIRWVLASAAWSCFISSPESRGSTLRSLRAFPPARCDRRLRKGDRCGSDYAEGKVGPVAIRTIGALTCNSQKVSPLGSIATETRRPVEARSIRWRKVILKSKMATRKTASTTVFQSAKKERVRQAGFGKVEQWASAKSACNHPRSRVILPLCFWRTGGVERYPP